SGNSDQRHDYNDRHHYHCYDDFDCHDDFDRPGIRGRRRRGTKRWRYWRLDRHRYIYEHNYNVCAAIFHNVDNISYDNLRCNYGTRARRRPGRHV
ncbi:MAG TPA: hypothetical protein VFN61_01230, partial [Acidimicrobiales bacterium]|nr:hypothetical protein [Acidimicrobiales bacterium]